MSDPPLGMMLLVFSGPRDGRLKGKMTIQTERVCHHPQYNEQMGTFVLTPGDRSKMAGRDNERCSTRGEWRIAYLERCPLYFSLLGGAHRDVGHFPLPPFRGRVIPPKTPSSESPQLAPPWPVPSRLTCRPWRVKPRGGVWWVGEGRAWWEKRRKRAAKNTK